MTFDLKVKSMDTHKGIGLLLNKGKNLGNTPNFVQTHFTIFSKFISGEIWVWQCLLFVSFCLLLSNQKKMFWIMTCLSI